MQLKVQWNSRSSRSAKAPCNYTELNKHKSQREKEKEREEWRERKKQRREGRKEAEEREDFYCFLFDYDDNKSQP